MPFPRRHKGCKRPKSIATWTPRLQTEVAETMELVRETSARLGHGVPGLAQEALTKEVLFDSYWPAGADIIQDKSRVTSVYPQSWKSFAACCRSTRTDDPASLNSPKAPPQLRNLKPWSRHWPLCQTLPDRPLPPCDPSSEQRPTPRTTPGPGAMAPGLALRAG